MIEKRWLMADIAVVGAAPSGHGVSDAWVSSWPSSAC